MFEAKVLITEMSFIRANHRREKIHKFGHMHLDDFVERAGPVQERADRRGHFSTRYHPNEVRKLLDDEAAAGAEGEDEAVGVSDAGCEALAVALRERRRRACPLTIALA